MQPERVHDGSCWLPGTVVAVLDKVRRRAEAWNVSDNVEALLIAWDDATANAAASSFVSLSSSNISSAEHIVADIVPLDRILALPTGSSESFRRGSNHGVWPCRCAWLNNVPVSDQPSLKATQRFVARARPWRIPSTKRKAPAPWLAWELRRPWTPWRYRSWSPDYILDFLKKMPHDFCRVPSLVRQQLHLDKARSLLSSPFLYRGQRPRDLFPAGAVFPDLIDEVAPSIGVVCDSGNRRGGVVDIHPAVPAAINATVRKNAVPADQSRQEEVPTPLCGLRWRPAMRGDAGTDGWLAYDGKRRRAELETVLPSWLLRGRSFFEIGSLDGNRCFHAEASGASSVHCADYQGFGGREFDTDADLFFADHWPGGMPPGGNSTFGLHGDLLRLSACLRQSRIRASRVNVYDLSPQVLDMEPADVVYVGGLLYHLKYPQIALEALRTVTDGVLILETESLREIKEPLCRYIRGNEVYGDPTFHFSCSSSALIGLLLRAGFSAVYEVNLDPLWNRGVFVAFKQHLPWVLSGLSSGNLIGDVVDSAVLNTSTYHQVLVGWATLRDKAEPRRGHGNLKSPRNDAWIRPQLRWRATHAWLFQPWSPSSAVMPEDAGASLVVRQLLSARLLRGRRFIAIAGNRKESVTVLTWCQCARAAHARFVVCGASLGHEFEGGTDASGRIRKSDDAAELADRIYGLLLMPSRGPLRQRFDVVYLGGLHFMEHTLLALAAVARVTTGLLVVDTEVLRGTDPRDAHCLFTGSLAHAMHGNHSDDSVWLCDLPMLVWTLRGLGFESVTELPSFASGDADAHALARDPPRSLLLAARSEALVFARDGGEGQRRQSQGRREIVQAASRRGRTV
eukprot:TRINITY_DN21726_c0_g1_i4.p1 TRINITY_DN21726_c0_g1~~TRINITY_DN21726_c0_g1_i4.p1  ORF type:complete len:949 (-),score=110.36 TRINITY_DN21726_c0_g1_i4:314-2869(-)